MWCCVLSYYDVEHPNVEPRPTVANLATVAVLPVSDKVPLSNFTLELQHALNGIGKLNDKYAMS